MSVSTISRTTRVMLAACIAVAMAIPLTAATTPAPSPQAAIAARQAGFKKMGAAMKALNDQLRSDAPAKDAMVGAAKILAMAAREQPRLFPAGSGPGGAAATDALPAVWTERASFDAQMSKMMAESGKLMAVAGSGDADAIRAQFKATGAVCSSCHRQFRSDS